MIFVLNVVLLPQLVHSTEVEQNLPSTDFVLKRVIERAEKEEENDRLFDSNYSYTRIKITQYRNVEGELKKNERKESHHDPLAQTASQQPQRAVTRLHSPKDTPTNPHLNETESRVRGKAVERKDFRLDEDLLSRFTFTLIGRETVNGRGMYVLEFEPRPGKLPVRSFKDKFINKAAGRVWVDDEDYAIAKAELRLTEKVDVILGLAGTVWQFQYGFERERTMEGLWFTRHVRWHLDAREVFVRRIVDYFEERTNVCKVR